MPELDLLNSDKNEPRLLRSRAGQSVFRHVLA